MGKEFSDKLKSKITCFVDEIIKERYSVDDLTNYISSSHNSDPLDPIYCEKCKRYYSIDDVSSTDKARIKYRYSVIFDGKTSESKEEKVVEECYKCRNNNLILKQVNKIIKEEK